MRREAKKQIRIIKASGEREPFSEEKLRSSLEKAKAKPEFIDQIVREVVLGLKDGTATSDIYFRAFSLLRRKEKLAAAIYSLKKAIMELGPTGHPFERLVGEILKSQGFSVEVSQLVRGACVTHEIDVAAIKDNQRIMVECKFHNQQGIKSDVKTALYVQARFQDIDKQWRHEPDHRERFHQAWLVTNTKLTSDAIVYSKCIGINAIGWSYPKGRSLQDLIESSGLHPLTCLIALSKHQKRQLLERGLVLCRDILRDKSVLRIFGANKSKTTQVLKEIEGLYR